MGFESDVVIFKFKFYFTAQTCPFLRRFVVFVSKISMTFTNACLYVIIVCDNIYYSLWTYVYSLFISGQMAALYQSSISTRSIFSLW